MMLKILSLSLLIWQTISSKPQARQPQISEECQELKLYKNLVLKSQSGNNGVALGYYPRKQLYYATYGGNENYPIEVFTRKGKFLHAEVVGFDARGLWYNPKSKRMEGNSFEYQGLYSFSPDRDGRPGLRHNQSFGQPNSQAAGSYDPKKNLVIFYDQQNNNVIFYNHDSGKETRRLPLQSQRARFYNPRLVFTGKKGQELALLAPEERLIITFDQKTGRESQVYCFNDMSLEIESFFNFDYSDGIFWIFNRERKIWAGYKAG